MRIVISGGTGFIGRALVQRFIGDGHAVTALVRSLPAARTTIAPEAQLIDIADAGAVDAAVGSCDAIVNLAGESVAEGRWTEARKQTLRTSRIGTTRLLINAAKRTGAPLRAFVSTSAIGIYGDRGDSVLDESSAHADDFLARLCVDWEAEAQAASALGARVAIIRVGLVLGAGGGAMAKMLPLFRAGLGGKLGSGKQWMSWIHRDDLVAVFAAAVSDERYSGVFNGTAPHPVTNSQLTKALGHVLRRPTVASAPAFVLRLALGGAADALLASQRVYPKKLTALDFTFAHDTVEAALTQIVSGQEAKQARATSTTDAPNAIVS